VVSNPRYATGVGLLLIGKKQVAQHIQSNIDANSFSRILERMKNWFQGNF